MNADFQSAHMPVMAEERRESSARHPAALYVPNERVVVVVWNSGGSSNVPGRTASDINSLGSPWRIQTSSKASVSGEVPAASAALDVPGQVAFAKKLTGLSADQLARLVGCSRQALHGWMSGAKVAAKNRERLSDLVATLAYVDRGNAEANADLLNSAHDGETVLSLLRQGRHAEVRAVAGRGGGRPDTSWGRPVAPPMAVAKDLRSMVVAEGTKTPHTGPRFAGQEKTKRLRLKKG